MTPPPTRPLPTWIALIAILAGLDLAAAFTFAAAGRGAF